MCLLGTAVRLVGHRQQRLELRGLRFLVNDRSLHVGEAGFFEHGFELRFAEAQPLIGVELARLLEAVLDQVEQDDAAAGG